jgi:L-ascorbate metabolism protein UlaG (beta-lactamase superfamily)
MQTRFLPTLLALTVLATTVAHAEDQATRTAAPTARLELQQIRNATARITFGQTTFLIDPMLSKKGTYPGFANTYRSELRNPLVELPMPAEDVVAGVDAVIVTHTHLDHWDDAAQAAIPKGLPLFVQHDADAAIIRKQGFTDVRVLGHHVEFGGVILSKTGGQHGTDEMYATQPLAGLLGEAMGVVFEAPGYGTVYLAGDTIWRDEVDKTLTDYKPSVIVLNAGYAKLTGFDGAIIMGKDDVLRAAQTIPTATVVAVHLDAINHMALGRAELRKFVMAQGIQDRVEIPEDGASLKF